MVLASQGHSVLEIYLQHTERVLLYMVLYKPQHYTCNVLWMVVIRSNWNSSHPVIDCVYSTASLVLTQVEDKRNPAPFE